MEGRPRAPIVEDMGQSSGTRAGGGDSGTGPVASVTISDPSAAARTSQASSFAMPT